MVSANSVADEDVERLIQIAALLAIEAQDLDDAVHECAAEQAVRRMNQAAVNGDAEEILDEGEAIGSTINTAGLAAQVRFLLLFGAPSEWIDDFEDVLAAREVRRPQSPLHQ